MKTAFLALLMLFPVLGVDGQIAEEKPVSPGTLQRLKTAFEQVLSGTGIRDLHRDFELKFDTLALRFKLHIAPKTPLPEYTLDTLDGLINQILGGTSHARLTGQIYFDRYTDRALVSVKGYTTDQIFQSIEIMVEPLGGMEAFSRRLHDYLKAEISQGHSWIDRLQDRTSICFIVERDGSLINVADTPFRTSLDAFVAQEQKGSPGIASGRPVAYELELRLYASYLQGKTGWPKDAEWRRRPILSWKKKGRQYLFSSLMRPDAPVVSFVYDAVLGQYRFPIAHAGSRDECSRLIMEIQKDPDKPPYFYRAFDRVYFYRNTNR
ncbi:hypothetical protein ACFQRK_22720 [Parapedobacter sp. GCM10030251]|uniref:hypothetical protein n=1 Tax=Parapedobacter sp. GCM10030251 TaxID=3273419 RepID=UPI003615D835